MLAEISAGLSSLNAATTFLKGLNAAKTEAEINDAKLGLQRSLLSAHQSLFAAQQAEAATATRIGELEAEIMRLKNWEGEKQHYELKSLGLGSFAYMTKADMRGTEPPHWLCTRCFQDGKKSIVQYQGIPKGEPDNGLHGCPSCKATFTVRHWARPKYFGMLRRIATAHFNLIRRRSKGQFHTYLRQPLAQ